MNRYVRDLLQELGVHRYDKALWTLSEYSWANPETGFPDLHELLDQHKTGIMRALLTEIDELNTDDMLYFVPQVLSALRSSGVTWPELDIIRRSMMRAVRQDDPIDETLMEGPDLRRYVKQDRGTMFVRIPVDEIWHTDGRGYWTGVAKPVHVLDIKQDMEPTGDLSGWIGDLAVYFDTDTWDTDRDGLIYTDPQFLKDLKNLFLRMGIPREIVDEISYSEQGAQGENWVSFDANAFADYVADQFIIGDADTMEQRKPEIMRELLIMIKQGGTVRVTALIKKLRELGADWPEFAAMERSIAAVRKTTTESQTRHRPALRAAQQALRDGNLADAIDTTMHAVRLGLPRESAKSLFDRYERRIRPLVQQETDPLTRWNTAGDLLGRIGVNWPWLDDVRAQGHGKIDESYRESPRMMAHHAKTIKHSLDNKRDWQVGYDFQKLGNVETQQVYDEFKQLAPDLAEWYLRIVATDPDLGGIPAIQSLHRAWQYLGDLYPEIRQAVGDSKPQVMRALLKAITLDQDGGNIEHVLRVIGDMRDMGIAWPELKTIARSITPRRSREP